MLTKEQGLQVERNTDARTGDVLVQRRSAMIRAKGRHRWVKECSLMSALNSFAEPVKLVAYLLTRVYREDRHPL